MIGVVGYSNYSGLGVMIKALRDQGIVTSQMVIRHPIKGTFDLISFPHTVADFKPTKEQLYEYIEKCNPDTIIFIETPFNFDFFEILYNKKIKVILIPMIDSISYKEFLPYSKYINLVINVTQVGNQIYKKNWAGVHTYIPWPVDTTHFNPKNRDDWNSATFLHNEGFGGAGFRKGTDMIFTAFRQLLYQYQIKGITLRVRSQCEESEHSQIIKGINHVIIDPGELACAIDTYNYGKIYIAPSRREGLGLPIPEAMACGLPVITTDAPPMNEWFIENNKLLLVKVQQQSMLPYGDILMFTCSVYDLMQKMKFAAENLNLMEEIGRQNCKIIQENFSWMKLKERWIHDCNFYNNNNF